MLLTYIVTALLSVGPQILIPAPADYEIGKGHLTLSEKVSYFIVTDASLGSDDLEDFEAYIDNCALHFVKSKRKAASSVIFYIGDKRFESMINARVLDNSCRNSAYSINIGKNGIVVKSVTVKGAFYAIQSLLQMKAVSDEFEYCTIIDYPRFPYRGMMLDLSRNFSGKDFICKQLDMMALLHMNTLHLHLTDDAGWRIQIDTYPKLTSVSAWRIGKTWKDWQTMHAYAEEGSPYASGGYLTKDDIRFIVNYAALRHIDVIPEIEIPGHSREVLEAYPCLACRVDKNDPSSSLYSSDICPGNEKTYEMFSNILEEVIELFPSKYIHIGGDEASKESWHKCEICREAIEKNGLKNIDELQDYCIGRISDFVRSKGRQIIGWDEILHEDIDAETAIMVWRGEEQCCKALEQGLDVILSPTTHCYLDYTQDPGFKEPESIGGYISLEKAYSFDPENSDKKAESGGKILGLQGNLWREYISTDEHTEYMLYPRFYALAEAGWTPREKRDYADFRERALMFSKIMLSKGYNSFALETEIGDRPESKEPISHLAVGKRVFYNTKYEDKYSGVGEGTLTDGLRGGCSHGTPRWLGFNDKDVDVIVDLEKNTDIHYVGATFMSAYGAWIGLPESVEILLSDDGKNFRKTASILNQVPSCVKEQLFMIFGSVMNERARYVRYVAKKREAPFNDWLFVDEIIVN